MSFWSHHRPEALIDPITDNAFDKLGNALKDGDVKEVDSLFKGIVDTASKAIARRRQRASR